MRSWPKFGDNPDKYRDIKNSGEDFATEIAESAQHSQQHVKPKIVSEVAEEYYNRIEKQCDC